MKNHFSVRSDENNEYSMAKMWFRQKYTDVQNFQYVAPQDADPPALQPRFIDDDEVL
jgi:hypothetical protein